MQLCNHEVCQKQVLYIKYCFVNNQPRNTYNKALIKIYEL